MTVTDAFGPQAGRPDLRVVPPPPSPPSPPSSEHGDATLGEALRSRRIERGLTQQELSQMIGVRQATISSWENGHTGPRKRQLEQLEAVLGALAGPIPLSSALQDTTTLVRLVDELAAMPPSRLDSSERMLLQLLDTTHSLLTSVRLARLRRTGQALAGPGRQVGG